MMQIHVVKSKIHRVKVTGADLNYIGSITIDEDLMEAANIIEGEKVQIVNNNNGERLETYVIPVSPWKKSYEQPRQHIQKQRHYFANKGPSKSRLWFFQ